MPQLDQIPEIYASQLFWLAIVFALIYFGIGKAMVPKIERTMEDRSARIAGDIAAAEAARDAARASDEAYQAGLEAARAEALRVTGGAKAQASAATEAAVKAAAAADEARIASALQAIDVRTGEALAEIETAVVDSVEAIVARLSGVQVDRGTIERNVKAALTHG
ncbi:ATPase [Sphingomonas sp. HT-1]|uniref:F0F1 ATP synthase subunit B family protein n=1 Tax=unclassified Sphingomonas TaxID=196159 RepID=UPI0002FB22DF|nr:MULTISPECIES: H+-transporting two-sector ATPase subunit B/B' [unclassified Sphingomonas]KTF69560.1 ATPase [Sphingomonas sp. WG]